MWIYGTYKMSGWPGKRRLSDTSYLQQKCSPRRYSCTSFESNALSESHGDRNDSGKETPASCSDADETHKSDKNLENRNGVKNTERNLRRIKSYEHVRKSSGEVNICNLLNYM